RRQERQEPEGRPRGVVAAGRAGLAVVGDDLAGRQGGGAGELVELVQAPPAVGALVVAEELQAVGDRLLGAGVAAALLDEPLAGGAGAAAEAAEVVRPAEPADGDAGQAGARDVRVEHGAAQPAARA